MTIADVASRARVDQSVVSRVVSGSEQLSIRPETRERVLQAIRELGYRPNAIARSLRTAKAATFGLLIPDFANPVYASIIKGAEAAAAARSCLLLTGSTSEDHFRTKGFLNALMDRVDGLLIAGDQTIRQARDQLGAFKLPWLMLNRRSLEGERHLILDDERAAAMAVEYLIQLGHRRIGHIAGPDWADTATRRKVGYLRGLQQNQLTSEFIETSDYTSAGGYSAMTRLLSGSNPPTAVFVANVASAIGALSAAKQMGFGVPAEVSVVAVHDLPLAAYLDPPLTTVRMPLEELGRRGVELLATLGSDQPITEVLQGAIELVVRGSTAPPKRRDG